MFKNKFNPLKSGMIPVVFALISFLILSYPVPVYAAASLTSFTSNPVLPCGAAGQTITITTVGKAAAYMTLNYAIFFSANTTAGDAGDVRVTGSACGQGGVVGVEGATSVDMTKVDVITIPAGTFNYIILTLTENSSYDCTNKAQLSFSTACAGSPITAQKSASPMSVCVGNNVTFCITATNTGGSAYTFNIWDTVPAGLTFVGCDNSCTLSGGVVSWTIPSLAAGGSVTRCFWASANTVPFYELHKIFLANNSWNPSVGKRYSVLYMLGNYDSFEN